MTLDCEVLVVGGGPAGCAAAYWLALHGRDVLLVERSTYPRARVCGDALTPVAVKELADMGCAPDAAGWHRHRGLRLTAHGRSLEVPWPQDGRWPGYGVVMRRSRLDALTFARAQSAGARVLTDTEVTAPLIAHGHLRGCIARRRNGDRARRSGGNDAGGRDGSGNGGADTADAEIVARARYVVIANGPSSRFGQALGTARTRTYAQGLAMRAYYPTPRHREPWIESVFALADRSGRQLPGYGWIFPVGDGTANVGVGLLSHHDGNEAISLERLFEQWTHQIPDRWEIDPGGPHSRPEGGRLPMGGSVRPQSGPNWVVVGDAAGSVNPWNGDGVGPALTTGRLAAEHICRALATDDGDELRQYEAELASRWQRYHHLGRLTTRALGRPGLMRKLTQLAIRSPRMGKLVVGISTDLIRGGSGPAGACNVYRAASGLARLRRDRS
ncbi:geranylgeranyl reductase family protein [Candidatus Poriferisodalis sp.]|uniref:geranylgeranyl reductase family protein n=1 Tax=Candidatus Poriferisodalis sp. TaxID=3101277 RepID=UPI003B0119AC